MQFLEKCIFLKKAYFFPRFFFFFCYDRGRTYLGVSVRFGGFDLG